jgi:glycosyltransferase involved in cell wall biosynthesis
MRVAIVNNQAPFVRGGAELLAEWLRLTLERYGHTAEIVRIPFQWNPPDRIIDHMLAARMIHIANADRVVAFKFPAYYVPHDAKVLWLLHQFRQAYELWGTAFQELPDTQFGHQIRESVIAADLRFLPEFQRMYTNSTIVGERLRTYTGLESEPLYPPLLDASPFRCEAYGDYFFYPSRINAIKRQHLAVAAMAHIKSGARLVIAGRPDTPGDLQRLLDVVHAHGLEDRVEIMPRWISEEEKVSLMANALGVVYVPLDEDSYGYVTLEAFHAQKCVLTMADSGGTLELVEHDRNGQVCADDRTLAGAMDQLYEDRSLAERQGLAAVATIAEHDISWDRVIGCLTA